MSDFSANLKRLRKRAERSQDSLAEELQVSRPDRLRLGAGEVLSGP